MAKEAVIAIVVTIVILVLLVVGGFLLWYFLWRNKEEDPLNITPPPPLDVNSPLFNIDPIPISVISLYVRGVDIFISGTDEIEATWTESGSDDNEMVLYASTGPLAFDRSGKPVPNNTEIYQSPSTDASVKKTTVKGLKIEETYNVALVVTNPRINGFNEVKGDPLFITSLQPLISVKIYISDIKDPGRIYAPTTVPGPAGYETRGSTAGLNTLFLYDTNGVLCNVPEDSTDTVCSNNSVVLSNSSGVLEVNTKSATTRENNTWNYDASKNTWCLKSDSTKCITNLNGSLLVGIGEPTHWQNTETG